jgi:hypothetical protein
LCINFFLKYTYRHPYGKKKGFLTVQGRVYAAPGRELKILINPPLGYTSPYKKEAIGQHIKSPGAGFSQKKW